MLPFPSPLLLHLLFPVDTDCTIDVDTVLLALLVLVASGVVLVVCSVALVLVLLANFWRADYVV